MSSTMTTLWMLSPVLCPLIAYAFKRTWGIDFHWGWGIPLGVLTGPFGLVAIVGLAFWSRHKSAADAEAERRRAGRPSLDSSGPSLDS